MIRLNKKIKIIISGLLLSLIALYFGSSILAPTSAKTTEEIGENVGFNVQLAQQKDGEYPLPQGSLYEGIDQLNVNNHILEVTSETENHPAFIKWSDFKLQSGVEYVIHAEAKGKTKQPVSVLLHVNDETFTLENIGGDGAEFIASDKTICLPNSTEPVKASIEVTTPEVSKDDHWELKDLSVKKGANARTLAVKYLDETGKVIAPEETIEGTVGKEYQTNSKEISGYTLKETPTNEKGTYTEETGQNVSYLYSKNVPKMAIEKTDKKDKTKENKKQQSPKPTPDLAFADDGKMWNGSGWDPLFSALPDGPYNGGQYAAGSAFIKDGKLHPQHTPGKDAHDFMINWVVPNGYFLKGKEYKLHVDCTVTGQTEYGLILRNNSAAGLLERYFTLSFTEDTNKDYTFTLPPDAKDDLVITFFGNDFVAENLVLSELHIGRTGKKDSQLKINYVDENNQPLKMSYTVDGFSQDPYDLTEQTDIYGYKFTHSTGAPMKGTFTPQAQEVTLHYEKADAEPVTAHYQYENGTKISEDTVINGKINDPYELKPKDLTKDDYVFEKSEGSLTGVLTDKAQEVTFTYKKVKRGTVVIHYTDLHGAPIPNVAEETMSGPVGTKYTKEDILKHKKEIPGYTFKWVNDFEDPGSFGTYKEEGSDVSITYRKDQIPMLKIVNVPSVDFGTQKLTRESRKLIPRTSTDVNDNTLTVVDTLGEKSTPWQLTVSLHDELKDSESGRKIKGSPLVFVTDLSDPDFGRQTIGIGGQGAVSVSGGDASSADADGEELKQSYTWSEDEGIFFETSPDRLIGNYEGLLDWTLTNAPS